MVDNENKNEIQELVESLPYISKKRQANRTLAQEKGFTDEYHMEGWLYFNRLDNSQYAGYEVDILHYSDGEYSLD